MPLAYISCLAHSDQPAQLWPLTTSRRPLAFRASSIGTNSMEVFRVFGGLGSVALASSTGGVPGFGPLGVRDDPTVGQQAQQAADREREDLDQQREPYRHLAKGRGPIVVE